MRVDTPSSHQSPSSVPVTGGIHPAPLDARGRERLLSLDVFRGLTIAGMLLVNTPGSWSAIYAPLRHAEWHGWTPTDLIFPFFLFIVGITTHLSLNARRANGADEGALLRQVLRRGGIIILLGLLLNAFPFYQWGTIAGVTDPSFLTRIAWRFEHLRIPGVLQRIGVVYLVIGLLALRIGARAQLVTLVALLLGYWALMTLVPVPDSGLPGWQVLDQAPATIAAWLDRALLGTNHLWAVTRTWDPEGILSTLPAIGTGLLGLLAGRWIGTARPLAERMSGMFAVGAITMVVGLVWAWTFPLNKNIWTSSYVLFTGGMAAVTLATCMWLIDDRGWRGWTTPWVAFGVNPILAYVGSGMMARLMYSVIRVDVNGTPTPIQTVIHSTIFASWLPPRAASLAFALSFVALWFLILLVLWRRRIILKV